MSWLRRRRWLPLTVLVAATTLLVASIVWAAAAWSAVGGMIGPAVRGDAPVRNLAAADRAAARFAQPWGLTVGEVMQFDNVRFTDRRGLDACSDLCLCATYMCATGAG